jgi:hypothetical protein
MEVSLPLFGFSLFFHINDYHKEKIMKVAMEVLRNRINYFLFGVIVVTYFGSGAFTNVYAQQKGACTDDVAKFCKDIRPGGGAITKCLEEHENDLSPACKEDIYKVKQKIQDFKEACRGDVNKFCKDVRPGRGRILQCLKQNEAELSPECRAVMTR